MAVQVASVSGQSIAIQLRYARVKRLLDFVFTLSLFIPLSITMVIVAAAIRLDSPGPVFFRQKRVGQNGAEFTMFKFRSMYANSDDAIHREAIERYMKGESIGEGAEALPYKRSDDPRITRVGRFLRKTSLDEIPQFINVLRGEMTLVGPRPPLPYEVELYSAGDLVRLSGKPGLTGTWQVYGRSSVTFQSMVDMDIAYLQKQSLREDLKLIALTVPVMIMGRGGA